METQALPVDNLDHQILRSWGRNVEPWITAVRAKQIESRRLVTDSALLEAILGRAPRSVLDLGCGEGWLTRALAPRGIHVVGIDAIAAFVEQARAAGSGEFYVASYEQLAAGQLKLTVDLLVSNFALLGHTAVEDLFRTAATLLNPGGAFVVQTLHPIMTGAELPYQDGWRNGSWVGFSSEFCDPPPWYFRTLGGWVRLFTDNHWRLLEMREPLHPQSNLPASVLFIAEPVARNNAG